MVLAERRLAGQHPNWTEALGSVAATINSQCGQGKNDLSMFEAVYGQKLDFPLTCSKKEAHKCWTVAERMKVTDNPEFNIYCSEHCCVDSDNKLQHDEDDDDAGYFSDEELPPDEMD